MRSFEIGTAAAIILVAAVAMFDTFGRSGWTANGPDAGWYPFWSAAAMAGAGFVSGAQALRKKGGAALFASREGGIAIGQLVVPMVVAAVLLPYLGLYIVSAAYMALFSRWVGRYSWPIVAVSGLAVPVAVYFGFEQAFKMSLPKSVLYFQGLLPF